MYKLCIDSFKQITVHGKKWSLRNTMDFNVFFKGQLKNVVLYLIHSVVTHVTSLDNIN